jgi:hypothetical protein
MTPIQKPPAGYPETKEQVRLNEARDSAVPWKKWGPYLSERQWGTVREDYSRDGDAWNYFTHDQSRSRAYRWGEDGLAGVSDDPSHQTGWTGVVARLAQLLYIDAGTMLESGVRKAATVQAT